ncbi:MAG TPA: RHS repeat-associated core domain-containing protein, partial [Polyangiaceae bacterium]
LRGAVLTSEARDEQGYVFSRSTSIYVGKSVGTSLDGRAIDYAFKRSEQIDQIEGRDATQARSTLSEWDQDEYGNVTIERRWGETANGNNLAGNDEATTIRTFATNRDDWILGRLATEELQDGQGHRVAARRVYYDGAALVGLPLGQVSRGDVSRREEWVGPDDGEWELDLATAYDKDGNPTETKDARGGGRIFTWDPHDHTTLQSESVKLEAGRKLTEISSIDPAFGNLLRVTGYDGQVTRFAYDPLGRVTDVYRPGDPDGMPTVRYSYAQGAPLSRVTSDRRVWPGREEFERTEELFDGLGRKRGALTREDGGKWVLTGLSLLDARGSPRRSLRARFVGETEHASPPLQTDGPGVDSWRDAMGRTTRTRTQLGIETQTLFEPFVTKHWDGAQNDARSPYEHTPSIETHDGLGRLVARTETLGTGMAGGRPITTTFTYDATGRLLSRTDPEMHTATYGYDGRGRRIWVKDPDAGEHHMTYDGAGNLTDTLRPDGKTHHLVFDLAGRVLTEDWDSDGKAEIVNTWDASARDPKSPLYAGKLVAVSDEGGHTENEYDERGRVSVVHHTIDGTTYDVGSKYDAQDREYLHVYPDGSSIRIRRNARGQLAGYGKAVTFDYDGDGVEMRRSFNTGVAERWGYDDDRRVHEAVVSAADNSELLHLMWNYDGAGNIVDLFDKRPGVDASLDRSEHYAYDNLYRLHTAEGTWGHATWTFSDSGNLLKRESSVPSLQALDIGYGEGAGPHAMTSFGGRKCQYDLRGRIKTDGDRTYDWNEDDQLTKVTTRGGNWVESHFNGNSERTLRVEHDALGNESRTHFIDAWSEVKDDKLIRYIVHSGQRIARLADGNGTNGAATGPLSSDSADGDEPPGHGRLSRLGRLASLASYLALVGSLFAALAWTYRRHWRRPWSWALLGAALALGGYACGSDNDQPAVPPIDDGTVQTLGEDDELLFNDQLGSLAEQTSGSGKITGSFAAYPFGIARYDTSKQTRRYANTVRDVHVGLDSMGARFYAPDLGIWTSPDPVSIENPERAVGADVAAANPYAYANLEPIIAKDEHGQWFHVAIGAAIGAAIGGAVEAYHQYKETGHVED